MRRVRVFKHGDDVGEVLVADSEAEALAQGYRAIGWECVAKDYVLGARLLKIGGNP